MQDVFNGDSKQVLPVPYSAEEKIYRGNIIQMLQNCRSERDMPHPEFDGLTYLEYYDTNKRADLSFIGPKRNKEDYRIVTGTTREKSSTILTAVLELNLKPDIFSFDEKNMDDYYMGMSFEDMVNDSRIQEDYPDKLRPVYYREMISQGDVFIEELYTEEFQPQVEVVKEWNPTMALDAFEVNEQLKKVFCGPRSKMITGKKVFLGDCKKMFMHEQPLACTYEVMTRTKAETIYGKWDRWQYVPYGVDSTIMPEFGDGPVYQDFNWSMYKVPKNQVGILKIFVPTANRFMIMLNGVMMLPIKYPLTAISPSGRIPITQGKFEPITDFAYSKGVSAKSKVDQALLDELLISFVTKTRQSTKPPLGNKSKKVLSRNITRAGNIINDVSKDQVFPIIDTPGVTAPEFSFLGLVKEFIDEKTVNPTFQGQSPSGQQTATEITELQKQNMMKLGYAIDAALNFERDMTWLRLFNILANYGKPMSEIVSADKKSIVNKYRTVTYKGAVEDGQEGLKMYRFSESFPTLMDQLKEEEAISEQYNGKPVRIVYLSPYTAELIKRRWYIEINPSEKKSDRLSQLVFLEMIDKAIAIFGPQSMNVDKLKRKFSKVFNVEYDDLFAEAQDPQQAAALLAEQSEKNGNGTGAPASEATAGKNALKAMMA